MREVFRKPEPEPEATRGVFYTVTAKDVGISSSIGTTAGTIPVNEVCGQITTIDIGRRFVAVLADDGQRTVWQMESYEQTRRRLAGE